MRTIRLLVAMSTMLMGFVPAARAQQPAAASIADTTISESRELIENKNWHFIGKVELKRPPDTTIFADDVKWSADTNHAIATGNVVFAQGANRIAAERADFDTETGLGTFYTAYGNANIQPPRRTTGQAGVAAPPPVVGQETDVYFYGDTVQKLGPRKYRITNGGFTTCVQPTPRWLLTSTTVLLNIDHYTMMRSAIFSVKGVPVFYLPILYYPTNRENRATGILIPTYGTSTLRGQSIHSAFFWAINRSQDATFMHEWYSKAGQGVSGEYRYNYGGGTDGNLNMHFLDQKETTFVLDDGTSSVLPAERSYEIVGGANQGISPRIRARANVNYFSSIVSMQTSNTNIYDASRNTRFYGGNVIGLLSGYSINGTLDHNEYFYPTTNGTGSSSLYGSWPRINISRNERPLGGSDLYYTVGGEYVYLLRNSITTTTASDGSTATSVENNSSLNRFDFNPQIRYPFKKLSWFTVNSTIGWRDTYYTRSLDPTSGQEIDQGLNRQFFEFQAQVLGPVFTRVWNTPDNKYAEKFKHTIEPYLNVDRTTAIDNFGQIVQLEGIDSIVGGATNYTYGLNNRFYAKRRPKTGGGPSLAREIIDVSFSQSYYSDERSAQYDRQYQTSFSGAPPSHFSPLAINVRTLLTDQFNTSFGAEIDSRYLALRTLSATATYTMANWLSTTGSWSKRALIPQLPGFDDPAFLDQYVNTSTNFHAPDNRFGMIYSFNYDVLHASLLQQRITGFYNAQCCGISFEYQAYDLSGIGSTLAVPADHRFFMSFTLAGLGNFSPFSGALSGAPR